VSRAKHGPSAAPGVSRAPRAPTEAQLARFARVVLSILEDDEDWSSDTLDGISAEAFRLGLVRHDGNGRWRAVRS
jgi:hypothetical protein